MSICIGQMGMSRVDFWQSEYREIIAAIHGYKAKVRDAVILSWEQTRIIAFNALRGSANLKPGSLRKPKELMVFPWEEKADKRKRKKIDPIEAQKVFDMWDEQERNKLLNNALKHR